eukprot:g27794.t1
MDHEVKVYVFHVFSKRDLRNATFDDDMGWNFNGFGPWGCLDASDQWCFHCYHVGGECGQGLFYNLFYLADSVFSWALAAEGAVRPIGVMLDGCRWLHENSVRVRGFPTVPSHDYMQQRANQQSRALEPSRPSQSQAVAGPAVLALRRMRNRMSSLAEAWLVAERILAGQLFPCAEDNLPWTLSPRDPSNRGRSIMPSFNRTAASSNGASLVPTPPTRPKPNGRFWSRPWPRLNIMNSLGLSSGSGSSSNARGVSGSGEQSRPGTQATGARHSQQDPTPSSAQGSP